MSAEPGSPGAERRFPSRPGDFLLVLGFAAWHIYATWGDAALYLGDYGTWLHAVERFAGGEIPYVDFYWMYPPLSLWLLGLTVQAAGVSLPVIWTFTSALFVAISFAFALFVGMVVPRRFARATFFLGILFATAYAPTGSAPLAMGMYTPAAPLAGLVLLLAAWLALRAIEADDGSGGIALGLVVGIGIFTKQDIWLPALFLLGLIALLGYRRRGAGGAVLPVAAFGVVCLAGLLILGLEVGWSRVSRAFWSPGVLEAVGGRGQFSWERLTVQMGVAAALVALVAGATFAFDRGQRRARTIAAVALAVAALAATAHVGGSFLSGMQLADGAVDTVRTQAQGFVTSAGVEPVPVLKRSIVFSSERVVDHILPTILPVLAGILVLLGSAHIPRGRRRLLLILLGVAVLARARRGFESVDWFHLLLEIPVYALLLDSYGALRPPRRALQTLFVAAAAVGVYANWHHGSGLLTRRGGEVSIPVESARGTFLANESGQRWLTWLRPKLAEEDPTGELPLLVFGQNGGLSFFVGRENPTPWLLGAELSFWNQRQVLEPLYPPGRELFFLDVGLYRGLTRPRMGLHLLSWDLPREPSRFGADYPRFDPFRQCPIIGTLGNPENPFFTLHRCPG